jgi:phosphoribosylformimino-5-aminoimidazole carboxamide ribotide isomerase
VDASIIAAGGIATTDHLVHLAALGVEGAIVGTALYTGAIDLGQALRTLAAAGSGAGPGRPRAP